MMMALQARDCSKVTAFRKERERKQETKKAERERKQKKKTRSCHAAEHRRWTRGRGRMVVLSACLTSKAGKPLVARQVLAFGVRACEPFRACMRGSAGGSRSERAVTGPANVGAGRGTARALKLRRPRSLSCAATLAAIASVTAAAAAVCWASGIRVNGLLASSHIRRILTLQPLSLWR